MFKKLKAKLIFTIAAMVLVMSVVNLCIGVDMSYLALTDNVENNLQATVKTAQVGISALLQVYKNEAVAIARSIPVAGDGYAKAAAQATVSAGYFGWKGAAFVDAEGNVYSKDKSLNGMNIAAEDFFRRAYEGETLLSTTYSDTNGNLRIFVCTPGSGTKSVFMIVLDGMTLRNMIRDIVIGETGNVFVLDKDGAMIANVREEMVKKRDNYIEIAKMDETAASMGAVYTKMAAGESGVSEYEFKGVPRIAAYLPIDGSDGWSVGGVAPKAEMTSSIGLSVVGMSVSSAAVMVLAILITVRLSHGIAAPIRNVSERIRLLAGGDLHTQVPQVKGKDETGQLAEAAQSIVDNLSSIINDLSWGLSELAKGNFTVDSRVKELYVGDYEPLAISMYSIINHLAATLEEINMASEQVSSGSEQVAAGAQALSQGAAQQASAIEELTATINDVSNRVSENAANAKNVKATVGEVGGKLLESNQRMLQMTEAMDEITIVSTDIGKIIKAIEDIAFQTNILALNATMEAARAGSAGRGFAVVAGEVRSLAGKSSEASKSTAELIQRSLQAVTRGSQIAGETADSLSAVVEGTREITGQIDQIAAASEEQSSSIAQITQGMEQISSVVKTNSATAEESAAASQELSSQAQMLSELVGSFQFRQKNIG